MVAFVLVILTIISCLLFEVSGLATTTRSLVASYKLQFRIMADKSLDDTGKQQQLLQQISRQLLLILKLIFGIILFILPFLSLYLLQYFDDSLRPQVLASWLGVVVPVVTAVFYILLKRSYARIFQNR